MKRLATIAGVTALLMSIAIAAHAAFGATGETNVSVAARADWTGPSVTQAAVVGSAGNAGWLRQNDGYRVYANATDSGAPASGVATITANVSTITTGASAALLTACSSSCTISGVTYAYRSAALTSNAILSEGSKAVSFSASDNGGNTKATTGFGATVDNTAPTPTITSPTAGSTTGATPAFGGARGSTSGDVAAVTLRIYSGSSATGTAVQTIAASVSGSTWSATASTLPNGTHTAQASQSDSAGNAGTSVAVTFTVSSDTTRPTANSWTANNGGGSSTANQADAGDVVTYTYSENMKASSFVSGWDGSARTVTLTVNDAAGTGSTDTVTVAGVNLGTVDLLRTDYVQSGSVTFTGSSMVLSGNAVTITLGTRCTAGASGCGSAITGGSNDKAKAIWTPSTAATDLSDNAVQATPRENGNVRSF